jgi:hypothetical protein
LPPLSGIFFWSFAIFPRVAWIAAVVGALLVGCTSASRPQPTPPVNLAGFPPAFREGYAAGCDSARARTTRRDEQRFKADRQYANGWRDGLDACGRSARRTQ